VPIPAGSCGILVQPVSEETAEPTDDVLDILHMWIACRATNPIVHCRGRIAAPEEPAAAPATEQSRRSIGLPACQPSRDVCGRGCGAEHSFMNLVGELIVAKSMMHQ